MPGITAPTRSRCGAALLAALATTAAIAAPEQADLAEAQPQDGQQVERPEASGRVVRVFDFDERAFNLDPVPMHWIRAHHVEGMRERPGFPNWNHSSFSSEFAHSGDESFMLPTSGGSVSARLVSGVLAAIPGSDYQVSAFARTKGLQSARGRLVARLLDADGAVIEGSEANSGLIQSEQGWRMVEATLEGDFPNAAWIQIDLELLQPSQFPPDDLALQMPHVQPHLVDDEDLSGAVWFDDVAVRHIPRLDVASATPTNIFVAPETPEFTFVLRDLTGDSLVGELSLMDESGAVVQRDTITTPPGGGEIVWSPEPNGFGWRRAVLNIVAEGVVLQQGTVSYCWVPPVDPLLDEDEQGWFGLIAETTPPDRTALLPAIAQRIGAGAMTLTVWDEWMHTGSAHSIATEIEPAVDKLLDDNRQTTFALRDVPGKGDASSLVGRRLIDLLGRDELWDIALDPLVARFGQRVHLWRLGAAGDRDIVWTQGVAQALAVSLDRLSRYAPSPMWVLPADADQTIDPGLHESNAFSVMLPIAAPNDSIGALVRRWIEPEDEDHTSAMLSEFVLETHQAGMYGSESAAIALAQRTILAWSAGARQLSIIQPWTHTGKAPGQADPSPNLAVWRTMGEHLKGRSYAGSLPIVDGVRAQILVDPSGTRCAIAAWNENAESDDATIRLHLGDDDIEAVDIFGNARTIEMIDGLHTIQLTDSPIFIEGVDPGLILFHAGFRIEPSLIRSSATVHDVEIVIRNPFPTSIVGRFRVDEPSDWKINPRVHRFSIGPGAEQRFPAEVSFGVAEIAGVKPVSLDVDLAATKTYPRITLRSNVEVGLSDLEMLPSVLVDTVKDRVVVTLQIRNLSDRPQSLEAYAMAPDRPRQSAPVSRLAPNESAIRRFYFRGNATRLRGEIIRVGLTEVDGPGRLNGIVKVN